MRPWIRLATGLLALSPALLSGQSDPLVMRIRSVAPRFQLISGFTNGNLLALVGSRGVFLVDGQSEKRVGLADSCLRTVTGLPVQILVNTHYHEDHISGNPYWRARGARIIAQEREPILALTDTTVTELEWHRTPAAKEALPDQTFRDSLVLDFEGEPIVLLHPIGAHTGGDAMIWFPRSNVIHTGDILEREAPPFIDWWGGGSLDGMIGGIDLVLAHINDSTVVVPGHGTPTDRTGVLHYRTMLVTLRDTLQSARARGQTIDEVVTAHPLYAYDQEFGGARRTATFLRWVWLGFGR